MNRLHHFAFGVLMLFVFTAIAADKSLPDEALLKTVVSRAGLERITTEPLKMEDPSARLCWQPPETLTTQLKPRVLEFAKIHPLPVFVHIFVTTNAVSTIVGTNFNKPYPVGTMVLKQKLAEKSSTDALLYTGMLKRETGYNPDCGDWEFFTISADEKKIPSRGRLESCMDCHRHYFRSDFIVRNYR
jgi:hypothetical protein